MLRLGEGIGALEENVAAERSSAVHFEHHAAASSINQRHLDWLSRQGVTGQALIDAGLVGVDYVRLEGDNYEPEDEGGVGAFINPVYEHGALVDLCAWLPGRPSRFALRRGVGCGLGDASMSKADWNEEPLKIHPHPLAWLQAGCDGAVVLDWQGAWWWLHRIERFDVYDRWTANKLDRALTAPKRHVIRLVPRPSA